MIRPGGQAPSRRKDVGFSGYSRSNAGVYHERMATSRSRWRVVAGIAVTLALFAALVWLLGLIFAPGIG